MPHGPSGDTEIKPLLYSRLYVNVGVGRKRQNVKTFTSTEIEFSDTVSTTKKGKRGLREQLTEALLLSGITLELSLEL